MRCKTDYFDYNKSCKVNDSNGNVIIWVCSLWKLSNREHALSLFLKQINISGKK